MVHVIEVVAQGLESVARENNFGGRGSWFYTMKIAA